MVLKGATKAKVCCAVPIKSVYGVTRVEAAKLGEPVHSLQAQQSPLRCIQVSVDSTGFIPDDRAYRDICELRGVDKKMRVHHL